MKETPMTDFELHHPKMRRTGAELQAARRQAAERFTAIAFGYVPADWTVEYRKSLSGRCCYETRVIVAPQPLTRKSLYIFLHECAHVHLHYPIYMRSKNAYRRKLKHVIEHEAELWAHEQMRKHGIAVPRVMTVRAKSYVRRKIRQARVHGAKRIDAAAARWAKK